MSRLVLAPEARHDLREIHGPIAKDDPSAARRVVIRLRNLTTMLAGAPAMGRARPELGDRVRLFVADRDVIFYRPLDQAGGIEVVRALHGARDVDPAFSKGED
jgi:toxin ParE1/3/4